jgi:integrase/recombinase XerD
MCDNPGMLTIYRRHRKDCPRKKESEVRVHLKGDIFIRQGKDRCACAVWVDGSLGGEEVRKSLGTASWDKAKLQVKAWATEKPVTPGSPITIEQSWERFIADANSRHLSEASIYKYELLSRQMKAFSEDHGYRFLIERTIEPLDAFRSTWKGGALTASKKLERLRTFFRFAVNRKWIAENPASGLKRPVVKDVPTLPFRHEEMIAILTAIEKHSLKIAASGKPNAARMRTLVLLLRYSGMRIGDAISLTPERIKGHRLFLHTAKTGTPVFTVLPDFLIRALEATPRVTERYYFGTAAGKLSTAVRMWDMRLKRIFDKAGILNGHAHRFRDTFATELLLRGVSMENVAALLGHQDIKITQKHYSAWVRSRQQQLENDVSRVWDFDPLVTTLSTEKGTSEVHTKDEVVN